MRQHDSSLSIASAKKSDALLTRAQLAQDVDGVYFAPGRRYTCAHALEQILQRANEPESQCYLPGLFAGMATHCGLCCENCLRKGRR